LEVYKNEVRDRTVFRLKMAWDEKTGQTISGVAIKILKSACGDIALMWGMVW